MPNRDDNRGYDAYRGQGRARDDREPGPGGEGRSFEEARDRARYERDRAEYARRYGAERPPYGEGSRFGFFGGQGSADGRDHDFDPDYLRWRDEQLKAHDRDYDEWRRHQHSQYDADYHRFRSERREHFGQRFQDWRSQRSAVGGIPDSGVSPGGGNYAARAADLGGYTHTDVEWRSNAPNDTPRGPISPDSEFGKEPSQVQAATDGTKERKGGDH